MRIHRNLIWLATEPGTLDLLLADGPLGRLVAARPTAGLVGVLPRDRARFEARLARLGQVARIVGAS